MYKFLKYVLDVFVALIALFFVSWLFLPCMLMLWCTGEHKVWYLQKRVGYKNRLFSIFKFATMLKDSPNMGTGCITTRNDPRVLPFGRFLRKTKINELPQILNVLNGTMSLVGPRPLVEKGFLLYPEEVRERIYNLRPGITGIGSIVFRDEEKYLSLPDVDPAETYKFKIMPYKGALELWYQDHISFVTDLKLVFLTGWVILFPRTDLPYKWLKGLPPRPEFIN